MTQEEEMKPTNFKVIKWINPSPLSLRRAIRIFGIPFYEYTEKFGVESFRTDAIYQTDAGLKFFCKVIADAKPLSLKYGLFKLK